MPSNALEEVAMSAAPFKPQQFNDLYSSVYAILDDAKEELDVVKLYKGSHAAGNPHHAVTEFGEFFFREQRGLLAYACSQIASTGQYVVEDLAAFDREHQPGTSTLKAFEKLSNEVRRPDETADDFLTYLVKREHSLGAYRGGSSGYNDEARAFAAIHLQGRGFTDSLSIDDVLTFCGGFKGVFYAFCASLLCERNYEELRPLGGRILAPEGYYQSLRLVPPLLGAELSVTPDLTGEALTDWLQSTAGHPGRAVYAPIVNNANGRVMDRNRASGIADAVLSYNRRHPDTPVYVLCDDVYGGSYLVSDLDPQPLGAITGTDLGDSGLGRMSDYTVTVITPSKTFAFPTCRVAFAATTNPGLRKALTHYRTVLSYGRVPQVDELTGMAAIAFTPQSWIESWNTRFRNRLAFLAAEIASINDALGFEAFRLNQPEGGWYAALNISPKLFATALNSSVDAFSVLLHYGRGKADSGIAMLPGELFGYRYRPGDPDSTFVVRGNFAVEFDVLREFTERLREMAFSLRAAGEQIEGYASQRSRAVADVDAIMRQLRY